MIAIVDYGAGNLASVVKALRAAGAEPRVVTDPSGLSDADGIVIPGVGHFDATRGLDASWRSAIRAHIDRGVPLLGICLGVQWLYAGSDEAPGLEGLGIFEGRAFRLTGDVKVPHVGWNTIAPVAESPLLTGVAAGAAVYFTHSYAAPAGAGTIATTEHGQTFAAIVERGNVAGMQFHPEKSGAAGLTLLRNWVSRAL
ncbi:MAG TPA: imidazole glycerol phosphate synthase subunit HisH [Vicinamibacterales bacterium]|nr:imidazole glycerol phosphate synthase subunit HisH [Vicinamibacterales bacterium]